MNKWILLPVQGAQPPTIVAGLLVWFVQKMVLILARSFITKHKPDGL